MFKLCESVNTVDVPADKIVHLFRSMRDVQLALPGIHAQQASAYLCQFEKESGICTAAVFHLQKSNLLAFYLEDPPIVPVNKTDNMLDQGLNFVESMGFLMTDQDIHLLEAADRDMLWSSLPLRSGLLSEEGSPAEAASPLPAAVVQPPATVASTAVTSSAQPLTAKTVSPRKEDAPPDAASDRVDDLLAAVEAMRAKRPGLRARRTPPTNEEMNRRRQQLRESVGRILASL